MTAPNRRPGPTAATGPLGPLLAVAVAVAAAAVAAAATGRAVADDPTPDGKLLQGTWVALSATVAGQAIELGGPGRSPPVAEITADELKVEFKGEELLRMRAAWNPAPSPAGARRRWGQLDGTIQGLVPAAGWYLYQPAPSTDGAEFLAINVGPGTAGRIDRFDNENLRFVFTRSGLTRMVDDLARPAPWASTAGTGGTGGLEGKWTLETIDGKPAPAGIVHEFRAGRFLKPLRFSDGTGGVTVEFRMEVRPDVEPKQLDVTLPAAGTQRGIYRLDGDRLVVSLAGFDKPRPSRFAADPATRASVATYRRATAEEARGGGPPDGAGLSEFMAVGSVWGGTLHEPYVSFTGSIAYDVLFKVTRRDGDAFEGTLTYVNQKDTYPVRGRIAGNKVTFTADYGRNRGRVAFAADLVGRSLSGGWGGGGRDSRFEVRFDRVEKGP